MLDETGGYPLVKVTKTTVWFEFHHVESMGKLHYFDRAIFKSDVSLREGMFFYLFVIFFKR